MATEDRVSASRQIAAPAAQIFAIVSDPRGQVRIDGSGMLMNSPDAQPLRAVGDTYTMNMDREPLGDLPLGKYQVVNTVTRFEPDVAVEWSVAGVGRNPVGHVYGYHLNPLADDLTEVTSYCDWSAISDAWRERVTFPVVPVAALISSLENLERVLSEPA